VRYNSVVPKLEAIETYSLLDPWINGSIVGRMIVVFRLASTYTVYKSQMTGLCRTRRQKKDGHQRREKVVLADAHRALAGYRAGVTSFH
jgi:hypothetical protein